MSSNMTPDSPNLEKTNSCITENQRLRGKVCKLSNENLDLENIISKKEKEVEIEKAKVTEKEEIIEGLNSTVSVYVEKTNCLEELHALNEKELAVKGKEIEDLKTQLEKAQAKLSDNQDEMQLTKEMLKKNSNDFSKQNKVLEKKNGEIFALNKRQEGLQEVIFNHEQELQVNREENCNLQVKLKAAAESDLEKSKELEKVQSELNMKILKVEQLERTLNRSMGELEQLKMSISDKDKAFKEQRHELHRVRNKNKEQEEHTEKMIAKFKRGEEEIKSELNSAGDKILQQNFTLEKVQKTLKEEHLKMEATEQENSKLSIELEFENLTVDSLKASLNECKLEGENLKKELAKNEQTVNALDTQLLEYETNEEVQRAAHSKEIQDLQENMLKQQRQLNELTAFIDEDHKYRVDQIVKYKILRDTISPSTSSLVEQQSGGDNTLENGNSASVVLQDNQPEMVIGEGSETGTLAASSSSASIPVIQRKSPLPCGPQGEPLEALQQDIQMNDNTSSSSDSFDTHPRNTKRQVTCQLCRRQFKAMQGLQSHKRVCTRYIKDSKYDDVTTDNCEQEPRPTTFGHTSISPHGPAKRKLDTTQEIRHGIATSSSNGVYLCECGKRFGNKEALKYHLSHHSRLENYE